MTDTAPNLTLVVVIAVLVAAGVYLLLERSLSRIVLGIVLLGNAVNLLLLVAGGAAGSAPIVGTSDQPMSDPLAQAMVLTAIVITLGLTGFLLALSYRSWQLHRHDEVQDDVEDRRIARLAARDAPSVEGSDVDSDDGTDLDDEARETHDETDEGRPATPHQAEPHPATPDPAEPHGPEPHQEGPR